MPYDNEPRRPEDLAKGGIAVIALFVIAIIALGVLVGCAILSDAPHEEPAVIDSALVLDTQNAKQMHDHGMPTKADCMQFHLHGQWGYYSDGMLYAFDSLPGSADTWDALYGIESDNPAYQY